MLKIIDSQKEFGSMNGGSICYSNLTEEDKKYLCEKYNIELKDLKDFDFRKDKQDLFRTHRKNFGEAMDFDGNKMFMADQEHKTGSYFEITQDYVEENPRGWTDIPEDILVVTEKTPKVVIGHPVADCPVVMMTDRKNKISAIAHCSAELIDKRMPQMIQEVLRRQYGSKAEDIFTYVGACVGEGWTYDIFPKWAKDAKVWDRCIFMGEDGLFHISLKPAIVAQLIESGLNNENIMFNMDDTATNPNYYSHSQSTKKDNPQEDKAGRHFEGLFYTDDESNNIEIHKGRR